MRCPSRWSFARWEAEGRVSSYRSGPTLIGSRTMRRCLCLLFIALFATLLGSEAAAQRASSDSSFLTVDRIFGSPEFRGGSFGPLAWLSDGVGYTTLERQAGGKPGQDIVRYDAETGLKTILVPASRLTPPGDSTPLEIEEYTWSADGRRLLIFTNSQQVWRTNTRGDYWVLDFLLYNVTDSLYAFTTPVQYPKAGQTNSAGRVGVMSASGGPTRWISIPGDPRNNYIARMDWVPGKGGSKELVIQHMNRLQDTLHVMLADAQTGQVRTVITEIDSAWIQQFDELRFLNGGKDILWESERSGWTQLYLFSRDGGTPRPLTSGTFDVLGVQRVDTIGKWVYYTASPDNPTQRYLYRVNYAKRAPVERITPASEPGFHFYNMSPSGRYAVHVYSRFGVPPTTSLVGLPDNHLIRALVDNAALKAKVAGLRLGTTEFRQVDIGSGIKLNAWFIKPPNFDSASRYPVLFYVYGGPGSQTVTDAWGGQNYLWYQMLAQRGYIVASVDNRGTGARGLAGRNVIYRQMGVVETQDQAAAARAVGRWSYVDSTRIGIWGWSYGGFMSLNVITQAPDVYRMAIAVAPVTHWKYYDTIYTERYNGLPQDNEIGRAHV